jgi:hypothetical protein
MSTTETPSSGDDRRKPIKSESLRMRFTPDDKALLARVTEAMEEPSDTQTVLRLIREKAKALKIDLKPKK